MLVNLQAVLAYAEEKKCAVGAFNTPNFECIMAVIHNAEKYQLPVIIEHAQVHENVMCHLKQSDLLWFISPKRPKFLYASIWIMEKALTI